MLVDHDPDECRAEKLSNGIEVRQESGVSGNWHAGDIRFTWSYNARKTEVPRPRTCTYQINRALTCARRALVPSGNPCEATPSPRCGTGFRTPSEASKATVFTAVLDT